MKFAAFRKSTLQFLLAALWAAAIFRVFWPHPAIDRAGAVALAAYSLLALSGARWPVVALCGALGAAAAGLALHFGGWADILRALESAVVFAAFFGTLGLLRATADARPEIARARALLANSARTERDAGILVGSHLIGSVLVVGMMAIISPIVGRDAPYADRKAGAEACQRGMCLAACWSPFWLAMAVIYQYLPAVHLWQIMALGMGVAACGLVLAHLMYARGVGLAALGRAISGLAPVMPPVALCAALVVGVSAATSLSSLQALITAVPVLCAFGLARLGPGRIRAAAIQVRDGLSAVGGEIAILTLSLALGAAIRVAIGKLALGDVIAAVDPPPAVVIAAIIAVVAVTALIGVHQMVTVSVMLVLVAELPLGIHDVVLMEAGLIAWGFASICGISAVSVAAASSMFGIELERMVYGPNLKFLAALGVMATALLAAVNALLV
jgi:hypothetical protein